MRKTFTITSLTALIPGSKTLLSMGRLWLMAIVAMSAVIFAVLAAGRGPDRESHEAILTTLRAVDVNHASLQRDVLQSRYGMLQNYDPLVISVVSLHSTINNLAKLFRRSDTFSDKSLVALLERLNHSVNRNEELVEGFKTQNSLLQNSLQIFGRTLTVLHEKQSGVGTSAPNDLGNQMMQFSLQPNAALAESLHQKLEGIVESNSTRFPGFHTLVSHGAVILTILPRVDQMVSEIQASDTSQRARDLQTEYLEEYSRQNLRASRSRIFLGSISFVLCGYVASLIYRLRLKSDRLARKLDFEAVLRNMKACFEDSSKSSYDYDLRRGIEFFIDFTEASFYQLDVINIETKEIEKVHKSDPGLSPSTKCCIVEAVARVTMGDASHTQSPRVFSMPLQYSVGPDVCGDDRNGGLVLGLRVSDRLAGVMAIEYRKARPNPRKDELEIFGELLHVLLVNIDQRRGMEEREILERRLEHAERLQAVGTLAGGIAHEFNNILGAMLGYGEMALHTLKRRSSTALYVEEIISAGQRAKKIIDQILSLSRKRERTTKPIDVVEIVNDILPLIEISLREGIELDARLPSRQAVVLGNPVEIQQIVMNLCKNSAEAIGSQGKIRLEVSVVDIPASRMLSHGELPAGSWIQLLVVDTGAGISEAAAPHIFEPFFTTRTHCGGTGLGLAAVHGNVVALSGHVDVKSELSVGTTFSIFLPICRKKPIPLREFFDDSKVPLGSGQLVGIVEASEPTRLMYEEKVAALGYEPIGFESIAGAEAWLHAGNPEFELMILDHASSGLTVSDTSPTCLVHDIPLVILTGPGSHKLSRSLDITHVTRLMKPVASKELAQAIFSGIHNISPSVQSNKY